LAERARIEAAAQAALEIERRAAAERAEADAAAQRQRQELIGEFRAITGCDNEEHLALFLGAYNDNLEVCRYRHLFVGRILHLFVLNI
jgi:hypothetical protein